MENQTACGYIRVSSADQASSLEVQLKAIQDYCSYKNMILVETFIDEDVSGFTHLEKRPAGRKLIQAINNKLASSVIAVKPDRLFRNVKDSIDTTSDWNDQGIQMHIVDLGGQAVNTSSAIGKMLFTVLITMSQFERDITGERTKAILQHKKAKGHAHSSEIFGFNNTKTPCNNSRGFDIISSVNEPEMKIVKEIFRYHNAGIAPGSIAKTLNNNGHTTKNNKQFLHTTIRYILKNPIYKDHI